MAAPAEPLLASRLWIAHRAKEDEHDGHSPAKSRRLCTGLRTVDIALEGGLDYGCTSGISAEANSGASEVMHSLLVSHLLGEPKAAATVIDATLSFDLRRVHGRLVEALRARGEEAEKAMAVLERLKIMKVFDFVGLTESIAEFRDELERFTTTTAQHPRDVQPAPRGTVGDSEDEEDVLDVPTPPGKPTPPQQQSEPQDNAMPGLLVIDNVTQVAAPLLKRSHAQGQALLTAFMRSLSHLTKAHTLCTILLNGTITYAQSNSETPSTFSSCALQPSLGKTFTYLLDLHLLVHTLPKTNADARVLYGEKRESRGGRDMAMADVVEILQDRVSGRVGRWAAFTVDADGRMAEAL